MRMNNEGIGTDLPSSVDGRTDDGRAQVRMSRRVDNRRNRLGSMLRSFASLVDVR